AGVHNMRYFLALGTSHESARVNHYIEHLSNLNPIEYFVKNIDWMDYGGNHIQNARGYIKYMDRNDTDLGLGFEFPVIAPGETVSFSFFYALNSNSIEEALA